MAIPETNIMAKESPEPGKPYPVSMDAELRAYLRRRFRKSQDVADFSQEVHKRSLEASKRTTIVDPRKFLFGIAARTVKEWLTKDTGSRIQYDSDAAHVASENPHELPANDVLNQISAESELNYRLRNLHPMKQRVLILKFHHGMSNQEIADHENYPYTPSKNTSQKPSLKSSSLRDQEASYERPD